MDQNLLQEIPPDDFQLLLRDLESDHPNSLLALSFLKTIGRWKAFDANVRAKILAINGDYRKRFIVFYIAPPDDSDFQGSIHKWSHREDDESLVQESLRRTDQVPWKSKSLLLSTLTPETAKAVLPVFNELREEGSWYSREDKIYWAPKEVAVKWTVEPPEGTYVTFLKVSNAEEINEVWPHRYDGSIDLIRAMIQVNFGIGLYDSKTNELMSWALHWFYGAIGVLHTKEQHRKKGYADVVVREISREIAKRGDDVYLNVIAKNTPSIKLMEKIGYDLLEDATWIHAATK